MAVLKIKDKSIKFLYLFAIAPLLIAVLSQFNVIDLSSQSTSILTILASLFILSEVGVMSMVQNKKLSKDPLRVFGALVAIIAILGATLSLSGVTFAILNTIQGLINALVIIYVIMEGFR
ncbi:MAG: hypothetical protein ACOCV1_00130 [Bacillota bacterium]